VAAQASTVLRVTAEPWISGFSLSEFSLERAGMPAMHAAARGSTPMKIAS